MRKVDSILVSDLGVERDLKMGKVQVISNTWFIL